MIFPNRNVLVLLRNDNRSEQDIEQELEYLNEILQLTESPQQFCIAHELVNRNRITSKPRRILKAIRYVELKPFRFLICRN